jgi:hypothetical protein
MDRCVDLTAGRVLYALQLPEPAPSKRNANLLTDLVV